MSEQRPEYIDTLLPGATLQDVFADLYSRGDSLAQELLIKRKVEGGITGTEIPGTAIDVNGGWCAKDDEIIRDYRWFTAGGLRYNRGLYYLQEEGLRPDETGESQPTKPVEVAGFQDGFSMIPSFSLRMHEDGMVSSHIHFLKLLPDDELTVDFIEATELTGASEHDGDEAVLQLEETDFKRLSLIANVIDLGITRTVLLNSGADFCEMFNIKLEVKKRSFLTRYLHLGRLFGVTG